MVGLDTYGSNRPQLAVQAAAGVRVIRQLSRDRDHLTLYAAGRETAEFYDNPPPATRQLLLEVLKEGLSAQPAQATVRPGHFWMVVSQRAERSTVPVEVIFFTDGSDDERLDRRRAVVADAVHRLAANPRLLRVTLCGVTPENRAHLRTTFAELSGRLQLRGPQELPSLSLAPLAVGGTTR